MVEGTSKYSENKYTYLDVHINFFNQTFLNNYAIPFHLMLCIADPVCHANCPDVSHCAHCSLNT